MTDPLIAVGEKIIDLLRQDQNFADVKAFYLGEYPFPPVNHYPLCEVVITDESESPQDTGNYWRDINGVIRFSTMHVRDHVPALDQRRAVIKSYVSVATYLQRTKDLFAKYSNHTLDGLTFDNGGLVQRFTINTDAQVGLAERPNNYENQGVVSFTCTIKEPRNYD